MLKRHKCRASPFPGEKLFFAEGVFESCGNPKAGQLRLENHAIRPDQHRGGATQSVSHGNFGAFSEIALRPRELVVRRVLARRRESAIKVETDENKTRVFAPRGLRRFKILHG